MSWDSYIDNLQAHAKDSEGKSHADSACIIGLDGSKWTSDAPANAIKITPTEAVNIGKCFQKNDFTPMQAGGVHIAGIKYQFLREEDGKLVLAKKKDHGAISMQKSKTAIVVAHVPEGGQQGTTNKAVAAIADYLESLNM